MWLDNYWKYKYIHSAQNCRPNSDYAVNMSSNPIIEISGGTIRYPLPYYPYYYNCTNRPTNIICSQSTNHWSDYAGYPNWVVGSGTTPAEASDYRLESEITTLSATAVTREYNVTDGTVTYSKTMKNTSSEEITVSEVGIVGMVYGYGSLTSSSYSVYNILVYRDVLDVPIVVGPDETFTVTITHKLTMPT